MRQFFGLRPLSAVPFRQVDVGQRGEQVRGAEGAGEEAALPEVSAGAVQAVEALGVDAVGASEGLGERVGALRDGDQMNVIGQQAVAEQGDAVEGAFAAQGSEVEAAVVVGAEDLLAVVAALGHVVGNAGSDEARFSCHDGGQYGIVRGLSPISPDLPGSLRILRIGAETPNGMRSARS